jgi:hypothetical protein
MSDCIGTGCKADVLMERIAALVVENTKLKAREAAIARWYEEGNAELFGPGKMPSMFALGRWWGERPWYRPFAATQEQ